VDGLVATLYHFDIELADSDRHVYERVLRASNQPTARSGVNLSTCGPLHLYFSPFWVAQLSSQL
jgi:hypothetical protein